MNFLQNSGLWFFYFRELYEMGFFGHEIPKPIYETVFGTNF
jgi:hypothetical protein